MPIPALKIPTPPTIHLPHSLGFAERLDDHLKVSEKDIRESLEAGLSFHSYTVAPASFPTFAKGATTAYIYQMLSALGEGGEPMAEKGGQAVSPDRESRWRGSVSLR